MREEVIERIVKILMSSRTQHGLSANQLKLNSLLEEVKYTKEEFGEALIRVTTYCIKKTYDISNRNSLEITNHKVLNYTNDIRTIIRECGFAEVTENFFVANNEAGSYVQLWINGYTIKLSIKGLEDLFYLSWYKLVRTKEEFEALLDKLHIRIVNQPLAESLADTLRAELIKAQI